MGCSGSAHPPKGVVEPNPTHKDTFWNEPVNKDTRVRLENNGTKVIGQKDGRIYVSHQNARDKTTRYWFKVNPGQNRICDFRIGAHHLSKEWNEDTEQEEWFIDDNWTVSLSNGQGLKECYVADKEDYMRENKTFTKVRAKGEDIVMVEIKGESLSFYIDNALVAKDAFHDRELNGESVYVVIDFEKNIDGDQVIYYGYDELPLSEPDWTPSHLKGKPAPQAKPGPAT